MHQNSVLPSQSILFPLLIPLHSSTNVNFLNLCISLRVLLVSVYYDPPEGICFPFQDIYLIYWKTGWRNLLYPFSNNWPYSLGGQILPLTYKVISTKVGFVIFLSKSLAKTYLIKRVTIFLIFLDSYQITINFKSGIKIEIIRKKRYWKFSVAPNTLKLWRNSPSPSGILTT